VVETPYTSFITWKEPDGKRLASVLRILTGKDSWETSLTLKRPTDSGKRKEDWPWIPAYGEGEQILWEVRLETQRKDLRRATIKLCGQPFPFAKKTSGGKDG